MTSLHVVPLPIHSDSAEWNYIKGEYVLAVGCYELDEKTNKREGLLLIYDVDEDTYLPTLKQSITMPGIFELKWNRNFLGIASSSGNVEIYSLDSNNLLSPLTSTSTPNSFALSVSWNSNSSIAVSYSTGKLSVHQLTQNELSPIWMNETAHSLETWVTSFHKTSENIFFSGADDCTLKMWDLRSPSISGSNSRSYLMGVTSIETICNDEFGLLVGSYDETVKYWDIRKWKSHVEELSVGGGVWKIKHREDNRIAVAAMHGQFKILEIQNHKLRLKTTYSDIHKSLAYGIDWMPNNQNVLASASFYDSLLSIWSDN